MLNKILLVLACAGFLAGIACGPAAETPNSNRPNTNVNIDPKNLPPGLSASPIAPSGNSTPGIPDPANANKFTKGPTPIPGIPDDPGKPLPKGATPTPGIPSEEEIRKMRSRTVSNSEVQNPGARTTTDAPTSGDSRSRKVNKKP
jgi:hypothetical protein